MKRPLGGRSPWIDPRIDLVTVAQIRAYLLSRGWREVPFPDPARLVFRGPDDDDGVPFDLVSSANEACDDYPLRLEYLIGTVASLENRPAAEVITDMLAGTSLNGAHRPLTQGAEAEKA